MDFVDKEDIAGRKIGKDRSEVADAFDRRARRGAQIRVPISLLIKWASVVFAKTRRAIEKHVLGLVLAAGGGRKENPKIFFDPDCWPMYSSHSVGRSA
jgi:hypothetical protein